MKEQALNPGGYPGTINGMECTATLYFDPETRELNIEVVPAEGAVKNIRGYDLDIILDSHTVRYYDDDTNFAMCLSDSQASQLCDARDEAVASVK